MLKTITAQGLHVDLDHHLDADKTINPAWQVDVIEAYVQKKPAGFVSLQYISTERMEKYFPDPLTHAMRKHGEHRAYKLLLDAKNEADFTDEDYMKACESLYGWLSQDTQDEIRQDPRSAYEKIKADRIKQYEPGYEDFKNFHLNKPSVDYSNVYDGQMHAAFIHGKKEYGFVADQNYQRQGIATVLYEAAALWMKERGMKLHASGLQSPSAEALWAHLDQKYGLDTEQYSDDTLRRSLDGNKVHLPLLEVEPSMEISPRHEHTPNIRPTL